MYKYLIENIPYSYLLFFLSITLIYKPIMIKVSMNVNMKKTQVFIKGRIIEGRKRLFICLKSFFSHIFSQFIEGHTRSLLKIS